MKQAGRLITIAALAFISAPAATSALAQPKGQPGTSTPLLVAAPGDPSLELESYRLWAGRAEGAASDDPEETPTVTIFRPQEGRSNGTAVVVAPGGAYIGLASNLEGRQVADWFASRGITAFLLKYRVGRRSRLPVPLLDGARAIRFVRANAARFGINPRRIGMIGFSAGGHLSATTAATAGASARPDAADPIDRASSRPDFLVLGYPWLEGTAINRSDHSQYCDFARVDCRPQDYERYLPIRSVTKDMPPTFIYHTTTDGLVPPDGSVRFYEALVAAHVPAELHIFATGDHGTGLGGSDPALTHWPELLEAWLRGLGLFDASAASSAK